MENIFNEVKDKLSIQQVIEHYLGIQFDRNKKCKCPFHNDTNASLSIKESTNTFHCFGCGASDSVIDFVMKYKNLEKFDAVKLLDSDFNLNLQFKEQNNKTQSIKSYILQCESNISKTDYFFKRGLSEKTIKQHRLGYDEKKKQVIIPYSSKLNYYQARSIVDKKFFKPPTDIAGTEPIYNENILYLENLDVPIFVVESPICAMSIEQYNGYAVATCGGNGLNKLSEIFKNKKVKSRLSFILCFDNDDAGVKFNQELSDFLKKEKIKFVSYNVAGNCKDPNELLMANSTEFVKNIVKAKDCFYKSCTSYGDLKSASEIMNMNFSPLIWYVDNLITNGANLLCGQSKCGKSWFILQMCLAVCNGTEFLDFKTTKSTCWYMALEDDERSTFERLKILLKDKIPPSNLLLSYELYPMDKVDKNKPTLDEYIDMTLKRNPNIKVIVIDTFQKIRSSTLYGEGMFAHDYRDISLFKKLAEKFKVSITVVHHVNKMKDKDTNGDPFAKISGTNGLMACADCTYMLYRPRNEEKGGLVYTGRKIRENQMILKFNEETRLWSKVGTVEEEAVKKEKEDYDKDVYVNTIKRLLERNNGTWTGTCTQLLEECSNNLGYTPSKDLSNLGKYLNEVDNKLKRYDKIIHIAPNKNGGNNGRPHSFYFMGKTQQELPLN
jgi:hypothetical protein